MSFVLIKAKLCEVQNKNKNVIIGKHALSLLQDGYANGNARGTGFIVAVLQTSALFPKIGEDTESRKLCSRLETEAGIS